jgi:hypothetical protein
LAEPIRIEGLSLAELRSMAPEDQDILVPFGRALAFHIGTATILAEFLERDGGLVVNLAHIDGGGEGVLLPLWKTILGWARQRGRPFVRWNVFAATCAEPNPRLLAFLKSHEFDEVDDLEHGRIFTRTTRLADASHRPTDVLGGQVGQAG